MSGADHECDTYGDTNAERHAEMTHGEAITDVTDSPHGAEESDLEQQACIE
jgi:hypothetical protein